jgi:arginine exporter protein ArgO
VTRGWHILLAGVILTTAVIACGLTATLVSDSPWAFTVGELVGSVVAYAALRLGYTVADRLFDRRERRRYYGR